MSHNSDLNKTTFLEHVHELRLRALWACLAITIGAIVGYLIHDKLLEIVQHPLGQTLYNTTPTGAFSFVIKICVVFGLLIGLPVIMYQLFSFLGPLINRKTKGVIAIFTLCSVALAISGAVFAYFVSLPAALNFLVNFTGGTNIQSIITANEYFNFAFAYILGAAVVFQIPLILLFINRIKPLKPSKLLWNIRYVLVFSFIAAAIITPTPDPVNQAIMAGPMILLYVIGVILVAIVGSKQRRLEKVQKLADKLPDPEPIEPVVEPKQTPASQPVPVLAARPALAMDIAPVKTTAIKVEPKPVQRIQPRPIQPIIRPGNPRIISDFI